MKFSFVMGYRDYWFQLWDSKPIRQAFYFFSGLSGLAIALGFLPGTQESPFSPALIAGLVGIPCLVTIRAYWRMRSDRARASVEIEIDEGGLNVRSGTRSSHFEWTAIAAISETRHSVLFQFSRLGAIHLPRRVLKEGDLDALRILAGRHIQKEPAPSQAHPAPRIADSATDAKSFDYAITLRHHYLASVLLQLKPPGLYTNALVYLGMAGVIVYWWGFSLWHAVLSLTAVFAYVQAILLITLLRQRHRNRTISGSQRAVLDGSGMTFSSVRWSGHIGWNDFKQIREAGNYLYFHVTGDPCVRFIPKDSLPAPRLAELRAALSHWYGGQLDLKQ